MQTTSLELSRKLHEAGLRLETELVWGHKVMNFGKKKGFEGFESILTKQQAIRIIKFSSDQITIPAPTESELWEVMPKGTTLEKAPYVITQYIARNPSVNPFEKADNPAEALGLLALSLREKGII